LKNLLKGGVPIFDPRSPVRFLTRQISDVIFLARQIFDTSNNWHVRFLTRQICGVKSMTRQKIGDQESRKSKNSNSAFLYAIHMPDRAATPHPHPHAAPPLLYRGRRPPALPAGRDDVTLARDDVRQVCPPWVDPFDPFDPWFDLCS
tara:strand:- start:326 stop:766 length:441 start_codon:yes stop_codon:yes gene_type:complete